MEIGWPFLAAVEDIVLALALGYPELGLVVQSPVQTDKNVSGLGVVWGVFFPLGKNSLVNSSYKGESDS